MEIAKPSVIVLVGYPGCGKTTWANHYYPNFSRVRAVSMEFLE